MYIAGIDYESFADGPGVRAVLFISGCHHKCKGCHSPETHSFTYGTLVTDELIDKINEELIKRPFLSGITLSGGDPMYIGNVDQVYELILDIRKTLPNKTIWLYTGFTYEEIMESNDEIMKKRQEIIKNLDVLIDGKFVEDLKNLNLKWRGSSNQRVIDIKKTFESNKIVLLENC